MAIIMQPRKNIRLFRQTSLWFGLVTLLAPLHSIAQQPGTQQPGTQQPDTQQPGHAARRQTTQSLIEWGWDEPNTSFIRSHVEQMEELPFDGLVFHVDSQRGGNFTWSMWGGRKFELDEFRHSIENLRATTFRRLKNRFLRVNVAPGNADWFDDAQWSNVAHNFRVAAQVAKQGQCRGFMFDVEQYESPLFNYREQALHQAKSFEEYQVRVRQRGRQWIETVNQEFRDITILLTFGYQMAQPRDGTDRSSAEYGLLADFLDGILEACSTQTRMVDAWEHSYPYRRREQFTEAYRVIKQIAPNWSSFPDKYRRHVQAGFGIWMDYDWRRNGWDVTDLSKNYFTPQAFETSVRGAAEVTDEFVWIYTEQPRWWTNERLPAPYVDALDRIRGAAHSRDQ